MGEVPVRVAVRVRPLVGQEKVHNVRECVQVIPGKPQLILGKDRGYTFDYVFPPPTTQDDLYQQCVEPLVKSCFEGYNATVFAYGQTGSGKTFTMGGWDSGTLLETEYGIIPRAVKEVFQVIKENEGKVEYKVRVSYIEIYLEEMRDLLEMETTSKEIHIREDEEGHTVVAGVCERIIESYDEAISCLDEGAACRHVGSTNMNEHSSRSHTIFTLCIEQHRSENDSEKEKKIPPESDAELGPYLAAKFHFVDLAGSERAHRTGNVGERFRESVSINTGLLALGNVVNALADGRKKGGHIPYRESKLTRLLKDSLGGNARTLMITCLSPAAPNLAENLNAVKYATRARNIKNKPVINRDPGDARLAEMQGEIQALREELKRQRRGSAETTTSDIDQQRIKYLEQELQSCRETSESYLNCLEEANTLMKGMIRAQSVSNEQVTAYQTWEKHLTQMKNRPVWTPNTARQNQRQMIDKLRTDIAKCQEDLSSDETIFKEKAETIARLKEEILELQEENESLRQRLQTVQVYKKRCDGQLLEQQLKINQQDMLIQQGLNDKTEHKVSNEAMERGGGAQSVPLGFVVDKTPLSARRKKLRTSPPGVNLDRIIQSFRARSQLLASFYEDNDEVRNTISDSDSDDEDDKKTSKEKSSSRALGQTWSARKGKQFATPKPGTAEPTRAKAQPDNKLSVEQAELEILRTSTQVNQTEVKRTDLRLHEAQNQLRDLNINIRHKEELIRELVHSGKEARDLNDQYAGRLNQMEKEVEKAQHDLDEAKKILEAKSHQGNSEKHKLEAEYKKKLLTLETQVQALKKKQKDNDKVGMIQSEREKKLKELELHVDKMRNQQDVLQKKLKAEAEHKMKVERELEREHLKIKELEDKHSQQQKMLKRKTEEVVAAQRKLRTVKKQGSDDRSDSEEQIKLDERKLWLDNEVEKFVKRKEAMDALSEDLKNREQIVAQKEAMLAEKSSLEMKKMRSSQVISKDLLRVSMQVNEVEKKIEEKGSQLSSDDNEVSSNKERLTSELQGLKKHHTELLRQQDILDKKLREGVILDPQEERSLIEVEEAIDTLEAAIEFKNQAIAEQREELGMAEDALVQEKQGLVSRLRAVSAPEARELLSRYFDKVVELRDQEKKLHLKCSEMDVQVKEQERVIHELERRLQQADLITDRKLTEVQRDYEQRMQVLMMKAKDTESPADEDEHNRDLESRIQQLEKDLFYYKKISRDLKRKLREVLTASAAASAASTVDVAESGPPDADQGHSNRHSAQVHTSASIPHSARREQSGVEASLKSHRSRASVQEASQTSIQQSQQDLTQDSIETGKNPWA